MFKYGRIQKKIPPRLLCDSHGACLDCMLPKVQVTAGLGFLCVPVVSVIVWTETPRLNRPSLLCRSVVGQCTMKYCNKT